MFHGNRSEEEHSHLAAFAGRAPFGPGGWFCVASKGALASISSKTIMFLRLVKTPAVGRELRGGSFRSMAGQGFGSPLDQTLVGAGVGTVGSMLGKPGVTSRERPARSETKTGLQCCHLRPHREPRETLAAKRIYPKGCHEPGLRDP